MIKTKGQHFRHLKLDERRPLRLRDPVWPGSQLASGWQNPSQDCLKFRPQKSTKCHETKLHISLWNIVWKKKLNWIIILYRSPTHRGCFAPFPKKLIVMKNLCSHQIDAKQRVETGQRSPRLHRSGWWRQGRKPLLGPRRPRSCFPPRRRWRWKAVCLSWPTAWRTISPTAPLTHPMSTRTASTSSWPR